MKILSNREYDKLIDDREGYKKELMQSLNVREDLFKHRTELEVENYKLKNIIKSYKGVDNKQTRTMIEKLYKIINFKLEDLNTSANELDTLFELYYSVKGTLDDGTNSNE